MATMPSIHELMGEYDLPYRLAALASEVARAYASDTQDDLGLIRAELARVHQTLLLSPRRERPGFWILDLECVVLSGILEILERYGSGRILERAEAIDAGLPAETERRGPV